MKSELRERIESEIETLQAARDDLRVRVHLGAAEVRDLWEEAERRWGRLEGRDSAASRRWKHRS